MPGGPVNTDALRDAVWTVARDMAARRRCFPAHRSDLAARRTAAIRAAPPGHQLLSLSIARTPTD